MNKYMCIALDEAKKAFDTGEIPVGAVVVKNGEVIASAHNLTETLNDATSHAELLAIKKACEKLSSKYLTDCEIYVTLEPCTMCAGAISNVHIKRLFIGASDKRKSVDIELLMNSDEKYKTEIYHGIMEDECSKLLTKFFEKLR